MGQELSGKVAIVTGGARGLGRAAVELFVAEGARVVIADVDVEGGQELAGKLGLAARFKRTDVADATQIQDLVDFAVGEFGGLHVMYNNAGIPDKALCRFVDAEFTNFSQVMAVNVLGTMLGCQRAARHMAKHGGGSIINTSSIAGLQASFGSSTYRASKAGIAHFTKAIAIDLAEYGIRVNCIVPGQIATGIVAAALVQGLTPERAARLELAVRELMMSYQPLKRQGTPADVAQAALYLASDRSSQVTGILLPVDGGVIAGDPVNHVEQLAQVRASVLSP
jgi:NAD(P)-dependent dehydrogenase (short-subunit alcohol dehydrogenase family)